MSDGRIHDKRLILGLVGFVGLLMAVSSFSVIAVEKVNGCIARQAENEFKGAVIHGPVSDGQCMKCHAPHSSDNSKGLKTAVPGLCLDCHDGLMKDARGEHLPSLKAIFEDSEMELHKPFADGDCSCCHDPHASPNYRLLNEDYNNSFYLSFSKEKYICLRCHSEKAFSEPRTMTETNFRNGNLNLHYRHVNRNKGRSCQTCHHHHASKNAALIRERIPFGESDITISLYEKTENGGKCASSCHRVAEYDRLDPFRAPMKVSEREGKDATYEELLRAMTESMKEPDVQN